MPLGRWFLHFLTPCSLKTTKNDIFPICLPLMSCLPTERSASLRTKRRIYACCWIRFCFIVYWWIVVNATLQVPHGSIDFIMAPNVYQGCSYHHALCSSWLRSVLHVRACWRITIQIQMDFFSNTDIQNRKNSHDNASENENDHSRHSANYIIRRLLYAKEFWPSFSN